MKAGCITVSVVSLCCLLMADQSQSYGQPAFSTTVGVGLSTAFQSPPTKIPPAIAMQQVKQEFDLVRLFDSVSCNLDATLMDEAVANSLEIVLTVPNNCLGQLDSDAAMYVTKSVLSWKDNIKAIIAGREIFEENGQGQPSMIVSRMNHLVTALAAEGLNIPVTTNINNAVIGPCPPACGFPVDDPAQTHFKEALKPVLRDILNYAESGPGFVTVDMYPWFAIQLAPPGAIKLTYATFQGDPAAGCFTTGESCENLFEAQFFGWNCAVLELFGKPKCTPTTAAVSQPTVVIGETGWASQGGPQPQLSSVPHEEAYINGYIKWVKAQSPPIRSFLFEMYDEDLKSGGSEEGHWGLYSAKNNTGTPKFTLEQTRTLFGFGGTPPADTVAEVACDMAAAIHTLMGDAGTPDTAVKPLNRALSKAGAACGAENIKASIKAVKKSIAFLEKAAKKGANVDLDIELLVNSVQFTAAAKIEEAIAKLGTDDKKVRQAQTKYDKAQAQEDPSRAVKLFGIAYNKANKVSK